jgi:hypothetical protein
MLLAERRDEAHQDESGTDPYNEPGEDLVEEDAETCADKDPADEGRAESGTSSPGRKGRGADEPTLEFEPDQRIRRAGGAFVHPAR